ncbi:MAG: sugar phosphate isomerase/epimerase, partial [Caldilineaceae bacterium]|nr:sugar phosphate isomerase/epimerase [Caldilineaceae bacterium]MCB0139940.1 sugar phosphate isomerase/epimerase [Caldilineaceae bacterium]
IAWAQLRRTLDELEPYARQRGVTIAIENLIDSVGIHAGAVALPDAADNFDRIEALFSLYAADFLTHCYDSGHAHLGYDRMERLDPIKERLTVLHLHDNDGSGDQHRLLFQDTIQWERLASLIAQSGYTKPISMEVSMRHSGIDDEAEFLRQAFETGARFAKMVAQAQNAV